MYTPSYSVELDMSWCWSHDLQPNQLSCNLKNSFQPLTVTKLVEIQGSRFNMWSCVDEEDERPAGRGGGIVVGGARQPQQRRNLRARLAALQRARGQLHRVDEVEGGSSSSGDDELDSGVEEGEGEKEFEGKIGTKKLRRIREKAERKAMREVIFGSSGMVFKSELPDGSIKISM